MDTATIPVSVVIMTHQHEKFIVQAMEGILMQHYRGPVQLIIANDASPDSTHERIQTFLQQKIPPNFTVENTRHPQNLGMMANFAWALSQATGRYTAFCEGDDYWTDPLKLQKQVTFLEANPDYALVFSNTALNAGSAFSRADLDLHLVSEDREYSPVEVFEKWTIPFNTVLYRNSLGPRFYTLISGKTDFLFADIVLFLYLAEQGKLYGMKDFTAVYRRHLGNVTLSDECRDERNRLRHFRALIAAFGSRYATPAVKRVLARYAWNSAEHAFRRGSMPSAAALLYHAFVYDFNRTASLLWSRVERVIKQ